MIITDPARSDLACVWEYHAAYRIELADRMVRLIHDQIELTRHHPERGERDPRVGGCRRFLVEPYLVFYQVVDQALYILRIYHSARRIEDLSLTG
ncbi:Plasmid stabilization system protein [Planctomycetes bacterium MalM25]|nr:Plasmid stabilization system protein [Planctomycetes bacterium MalM25]